jgi:LacI family transcriptional regulator
MLKNRQMDGFHYHAYARTRCEVEKLHAENRPVVLIDRYFPDLDISYVAIDNYRAHLKASIS